MSLLDKKSREEDKESKDLSKYSNLSTSSFSCESGRPSHKLLKIEKVQSILNSSHIPTFQIEIYFAPV